MLAVEQTAMKKRWDISWVTELCLMSILSVALDQDSLAVLSGGHLAKKEEVSQIKVCWRQKELTTLAINSIFSFTREHWDHLIMRLFTSSNTSPSPQWSEVYHQSFKDLHMWLWFCQDGYQWYTASTPSMHDIAQFLTDGDMYDA